jgi:prophage maintenance system killer protein
MAALTFLDLNKMRLDVDHDVLRQLAVDLASGAATKQIAIEFFEAHTKPLSK